MIRMRIENLHIVETNDSNEQDVYYYDPDIDVNAKEFRAEFDISENTVLIELPFSTDPDICKWTEQTIRNAIDYFMDDSCKSGPYYDPNNFLEALELSGITDERIRRAFLLRLLRIIELQFGY